MHRKARKAYLIGLIIVCATQLTGSLALLNYMTIIFKEAGSNLPPMLCSIIVSVIQVSGAYASTVFVEPAGRKTLLLLSTIGICLGEVAMASYYYLTSKGYETSSFSWVPLVSFSVIIFTAACGVLTVTFAFIAEITPPKIRSVMARVQMISMFVLATIIVKVSMLFCYKYIHMKVVQFSLSLSLSLFCSYFHFYLNLLEYPALYSYLLEFPLL